MSPVILSIGRLYALCIAGLLALAVMPAGASPWLEIGDKRMRSDVELLADAGVVAGPTSVWPLPWAQISRGLDGADRALMLPHVRAAYDRMQALSDYDLDERLKFSATLRAASAPSLRRDFSDRARDEADVIVSAASTVGRVHANLSLNVRDAPNENRVTLDGSYLAVAFGDWAVYGGQMDLWWGPSMEGSVLLSNNARPLRKIGLTRLVAEPFESRWLSWIGPWRFDGFVGRMSGVRSDVFKKPLLIGLRGTFEPVDGLEIGLSRLLQLCGRGRPCGFSTFLDSLVPIGQSDNTGTFSEPGNQGAGYELRYHWAMGQTHANAYVQGFAEDTLFEVLSLQVGASLTGPSDWGTWRVNIEAVDTHGRTFSKNGFNERQDGATYTHFIYLDGLAFKDRPLGFSLDGDAKLVTASASLTDAQNRYWYATAGRADINVTDTAIYRVSQNREQLWLGEAGVSWPTDVGDISVELRGYSDSPNTPGRRDADVQAELRWSLYF